MKKRNTARYCVSAALIAAIYVCLTLLTSVFGLAYSGLQFRLSEALNVLAAITPAAIPGLTLGCVLSNLTSPFGFLDIILGSIATLLSAICIRMIEKKERKTNLILFSLPPALLNALVVGFVSALFTEGTSKSVVFFITGLQVFISEVVVMIVLGAPLYKFSKTRLKGHI